MKFFPVQQGSAQWYELRVGRPTSSNFHKIVTGKGEPSKQAIKYLYRLVAERLLGRLRPGAALVTVGDFHPATLSWLGAVAGNPIVPLGVDRFGQSGDIPDLYQAYGIDTEAILDAAARACLLPLR